VLGVVLSVDNRVYGVLEFMSVSEVCSILVLLCVIESLILCTAGKLLKIMALIFQSIEERNHWPILLHNFSRNPVSFLCY
jgi:hypothetical protein